MIVSLKHSIFLLKLKGEKRRVEIKIVEYNLQLQAHNGNGFDNWITLYNLPCDKHNVDIIEDGKRIISPNGFNGYIQKNKNQIPEYLIFR